MNQCFSVHPYGFLSKMVLSPWVLLIPYASLYVPTHQLESLKRWSSKFLLLLHCRPKVLNRNQLWRIWRESNVSVSSFCNRLLHVISNVYWGCWLPTLPRQHLLLLDHGPLIPKLIDVIAVAVEKQVLALCMDCQLFHPNPIASLASSL